MFDAGTISATLRVSRDQFKRDLDAAKADAKKFSDGKYEAKLQADSKPAIRDTKAAQAEADKFGRTTATATLRVNNAGAERNIAQTKKSAEGIGTAFSKVPLSVTAVSAALPAAINLTGLLGGAAAGVGGAFASAGLAAGAFGAVAIPMFTQTATAIKAAQTAQTALAKATTSAQRQTALRNEKVALDKLTPSEVQLYHAVTNLDDAWKKQSKALQPDVWRAIEPYIGAVTSSLSLLPLIVPKTSAAIQGVGVELKTLMSSGVTTDFARFLGTTGSSSLHAGGSFLVDVLQTVEELLPQFAPLIDGADRSIVRWGADMARWGASAGAKNGIRDFISWVRENEPAAEAFLKNLTAALVNVGKSELAGGNVELRALSVILHGIASLPPQMFAPIVDGLTAVALASKLPFGAKGLNLLGNTLTGLAGKATGIGAAVTAVKALSGTMEGLSAAEKGAAISGAALEAITPFGWAVAGTAAIAALGYVLIRNAPTVDHFTDALARQDKAAGYNIAGYQKLARQLDAPISATTKLGKAVQDTAPAFDRARVGAAAYAPAVGEVHQKSLQAAQTASRLDTAMRGLGGQYGISEKQAIGVAEAAGISAKAWGGNAKAVEKLDGRVAAYVLTNEHALPKQQEENYLMQVFGSAAENTSTQVTALDTSFRLLVGDFVSKQVAILNAKQAIKGFGDSIRATGARSVDSQQQFYGAVESIHQMGDALTKAKTPAASFYRQLENQIQALRNSGPLTKNEKIALQGLQEWLDRASQSTHGMTKQQIAAAQSTEGMTGNAIKAAQALEKNFVPQLINAGAQSKVSKTDIDRLVNSVINTGTKSESTHDARQQLITDLKNAGIHADTARQLVNKLIGRIEAIPSKKNVSINVNGHGVWSISQIGTQGGLDKGGFPAQKSTAAGWMVSGGTAGQDSVPIMAMPGELVVPTALVQAGMVDNLRGMIPGFASGGVVGAYSGGARGEGPWTAREYAATAKAIEQSTATAAAGGISKAVAAAQKAAAGGFGVAGPGGGQPAANAALARSMMPAWGSGAEWAAWNALEMHEAGWNQYARNPSSGAYGIPQALPASKMGAAANPPQSNPHAQISWMISYLQGRYGDPIHAWAQYYNHPGGVGWYAGGGLVPHFASGGVVSGKPILPVRGDGSNTSKSGGSNTIGYVRGDGSSVPKAGSGQLSKDSAELKKAQAELDKLQKAAAAHVKKLRVPLERDELNLLDHPGMAESRKKALEASISKQEKVVKDYRDAQTKKEDALTKKIALLKKLIATDSAKGSSGPAPKIPAGSQKTYLAKLAGDVTKLAKLKKTVNARLKAMRRPIKTEELYLLEHPGLAAAKKSSIEAEIKRQEAAVAKYRKGQVKSEDTLQSEITLLRSLTGEPDDTKYGGPGTGDTTDDSGTGTDTTPPAGVFTGILPGPPAAYGGLDITGGGTGGLGGSGSSSPLVSLPSAPAFVSPGGEGFGSNYGTSASGAGLTGPVSGLPAVPGAGGTVGSGAEYYLAQLVALAKTAPAETGGHLGRALNGVSRSAYARATFSAR